MEILSGIPMRILRTQVPDDIHHLFKMICCERQTTIQKTIEDFVKKLIEEDRKNKRINEK